MSGKDFLLDTNIVITLLNKDEFLLEKIISQSQISIPVIAIGELIYGAYNSKNVANNIAAIERICNIFQTINCTSETAKYYGLIKKQLKDKGKPIPENDIWIAAIAAENRLALVTRDKHFENIELIQKLVGLRNLLKKYSGPLPIILKLGSDRAAVDSKFWVIGSGDLLREINSLN